MNRTSSNSNELSKQPEVEANPGPSATPTAAHAEEQRKYRGQTAQYSDMFWETTYDD